MNKRAVLHLVAFMTLFVGIAMVLSAGVSVLMKDPLTIGWAFLQSALITLAISLILFFTTRGPATLGRRDGFGVVTIGWILVVLVGSLPFLLTHSIPQFVPALFETVSGFTTTGATVIPDVESLPKGILFWRSLTHWLGGMGVIILCVAILPFLGIGGMQIYRAEMPGPFKDRLTPQITSTAKRLWGVYVLITLLETLFLKCLGKMSFFDALCHAFSTVATGGFSTRNASIGAFNNPTIEIIITVFMFISGINFSLHHLALTRNPRCYFKDSEFKVYSSLIVLTSALIAFNLWQTQSLPLLSSFRYACFTTSSIMTTTGFCTADFNLWPIPSQFILILLMFIGGCAGSTSGGIKVVRILVVFKTIFREMKVFMRPSAAIAIKIGKNPIETEVVRHICGFFLLFILTFALGTLLMTYYTPDLITASSAVIASLGNAGPGFNAVGPLSNYASLPQTAQLILTLCMLLGRLEFYTFIMLFLPSLWKR